MHLYYTVLIVTSLWVTWNYKLPCSLFCQDHSMCYELTWDPQLSGHCFILLPQPLKLLAMNRRRGELITRESRCSVLPTFICPISVLPADMVVTALSKAIYNSATCSSTQRARKHTVIFLLMTSCHKRNFGFQSSHQIVVTKQNIFNEE